VVLSYVILVILIIKKEGKPNQHRQAHEEIRSNRLLFVYSPLRDSNEKRKNEQNNFQSDDHYNFSCKKLN